MGFVGKAEWVGGTLMERFATIKSPERWWEHAARGESGGRAVHAFFDFQSFRKSTTKI